MKTKLLSLLLSGACLMGAAPAHALLVLGPGDAFATSNTNSDFGTTAAIETGFGLTAGSLLGFTLYYKSEVSGSTGVGADSGPFAAIYSTTFSDTPTDPADALITYVSGTAIACPTCYLIVKDGSQTPAQYLLDLGSWDGLMDIHLTGFWPNQGAISNVAIWGLEDGTDDPGAIPEPASLALVGLGLAGLGALRRRCT